MKKYAPFAFLFTGAAFVIPQLIAKVSGEPIRGAFVVIGISFIIMAIGLFRHSMGKSGNPPTPPGR